MNRWFYILLAVLGVIAIGIIFRPAEQMVNVFFPNSVQDPQMMDCSKVYPISRKISKIEQIEHAAIEELLKGPTAQEKVDGYFTSINTGVNVQSLKVENGTARIDFDRQLEFQVGGSCRVASIASQIRETLRQFQNVRDVIISIDGRTEDILQP